MADIPCPSCKRRCHLMAGVLLDPKLIHDRVHVCWHCDYMRVVRPNAQWVKFGPAAKIKTQWKKHTKHHWQTLIKGEVLDYWPSKRKWRFQDCTQVGDVDKFIKGLHP